MVANEVNIREVAKEILEVFEKNGIKDEYAKIAVLECIKLSVYEFIKSVAMKQNEQGDGY